MGGGAVNINKLHNLEYLNYFFIHWFYNFFDFTKFNYLFKLPRLRLENILKVVFKRIMWIQRLRKIQ